MAKITLTDISSGYQSLSTYNANNTLIETAIENTLSRDGTGPNTMSADLDMNSNYINNLQDAVQNQQPITLAQAASIAGVTNPLSRENVGAVFYPVTTAETAASVTPTNYYYEPGNVLRYGAVRDSGTDDSAAIQAAIDQAEQQDGATVYIPAGDYHIERQLEVENRDVRIEGTNATVLQWNGPTPFTDTFVDGDVDTSTNRITVTGHSFTNGDYASLTTTGTLPGGLSSATDTKYYVSVVDANTIELYSDRQLTSIVDITSNAGGGTHTISITNACLYLNGLSAGVKLGCIIDGITIEDETTGSTLFNIRNFHRSRFYNMRLWASTIRTDMDSVGLMLDECWINAFYGLRINLLSTGIQFGPDGGGVNGTSFFEAQIENYNNAGVWVPNSAGGLNAVTFYGSTIEGSALEKTGVLIEGGDCQINFIGTYFEGNDYDIYLSGAGGSDNPINVTNCIFRTGDTTLPHIYHEQQATTLRAFGNHFGQRDGIQIGSTTARLYAGMNYANGAGKYEVTGPTITNITSANPPVVTAASHGFSDGDRIWIDYVTGMTQINQSTDTVANATTNTFELSGVDASTGYTAHSGSTGRAMYADKTHQIRQAGDGYLQFLGGRGIKYGPHHIPKVQTGTVSVGATSSAPVNFNASGAANGDSFFSRTPQVFVTSVSPNAGELSVDSIDLEGCVIYNHAAGTRSVDWMAVEAE
jgi:hypothetical protein